MHVYPDESCVFSVALPGLCGFRSTFTDGQGNATKISKFNSIYLCHQGIRGRMVGWGNITKARRSRIRLSIVLGYFRSSNPSSRIMALRSTHLLIEMSTGNNHNGKGWPARETNSLIPICEQTVYEMWEPRRLSNPCVTVAGYRDVFTFIFTHVPSGIPTMQSWGD